VHAKKAKREYKFLKRDRVEWSASNSHRFAPRGKKPLLSTRGAVRIVEAPMVEI